MSVLSDRTLRRIGHELIDPFDVERVQPASIDLTLGTSFAAYPPHSKMLHFVEALDLGDQRERNILPERFEDREEWWLQPGDFALGSTEERVTVPVDVVGRIEGKSSLGRMGLLVHLTAGYMDPGFEGRVTLEFFNANDRAIRLVPGVAVCQVSFEWMDEPAELPYGSPGLGSKYQGQRTVTESRYAG